MSIEENNEERVFKIIVKNMDGVQITKKLYTDFKQFLKSAEKYTKECSSYATIESYEHINNKWKRL